MFLLDTNVIAELRKTSTGKANPRVVAWSNSISRQDAFVSAITLLELEKGILQVERRDPQQGVRLRQWMNAQVIPSFSGRVLAVDAAVAVLCARLHVPDPRPERDALIAATALVHSMTVATRNVADFESTEVEIVNPWEWEPGRTTLHREMQQILREKANAWMSSAELATAVNLRGHYHRRDGADVPPSQIAARASRYDRLFETNAKDACIRLRSTST